MATERNFITPADMTILTTANVVGNTVSTGMFANTQTAQTYPSLTINFAMNPRLDPRLTFFRSSNATYVAANGMIAYANSNIARFEYDPVSGNCNGWLNEEGRTNYIPQSMYANSTNWGGYGVEGSGIINTAYDIAANAAISPDGTNNASFLYWKSAPNPNYSWQVTYPLQTNMVSGATYTQSIFVKPGPVADSAFYMGHYDTTDSGENLQVYYYPANNTITGAVYSANVMFTTPPAMQDYPNGWKRLYFSYRYLTGSSHGVQFKHSLNGPVTQANVGRQGFYIWGAQVEQGPYVTSYIPTYGATASRASEAMYMYDIGNLLGPKTTTIFAKFASTGYMGNTALTNDRRWHSVWQMYTSYVPETSVRNDGTAERIGLAFLNYDTAYMGTTYMYWVTYANNVGTTSYNGFVPNTSINYNQYISTANFITAGTRIESNNWVMYASNASYYTAGSNVSPILSTLRLGTDMNGYIKTFTIFPRDLPTVVAQNMTAV